MPSSGRSYVKTACTGTTAFLWCCSNRPQFCISIHLFALNPHSPTVHCHMSLSCTVLHWKHRYANGTFSRALLPPLCGRPPRFWFTQHPTITTCLPSHQISPPLWYFSVISNLYTAILPPSVDMQPTKRPDGHHCSEDYCQPVRRCLCRLFLCRTWICAVLVLTSFINNK